MRKPRILFIAPSSYPIRDPEANVNAKLLKLLSENGYVIDLVSRSTTISYYPESVDDLFFGKLNSIHRIQMNPKFDLRTIWNHVAGFLKTGYVYKMSDWLNEAYTVCNKLLKENKYDFIYTYNEPSEVLGLVLSQKHGVRWVATWNDPYMWKKCPPPYGQGPHYKVKYPLRRRLIKQCGKRAYRHIFPSERLRDYMVGYMGMKKEDCLIAPHLVTDALKVPNTKPLGDTLTVLHSGVVGAYRDPKTFCQGLRLFLDQTPDARIKFSFLGLSFTNDLFSQYVADNRLEEYIERLPPVTYEESFRAIERFDAAMVLEADCAEGIFLPSKIADYKQLGKPILSLSPRVGVIADLGDAIDYVANVADPQSIADTIGQMYRDFEQKTLRAKVPEVVEFSEAHILALHNSLSDDV